MNKRVQQVIVQPWLRSASNGCIQANANLRTWRQAESALLHVWARNSLPPTPRDNNLTTLINSDKWSKNFHEKSHHNYVVPCTGPPMLPTPKSTC